MAELLDQSDYGWFTPADLRQVIQGIHKTHDWTRVILVGGQSLTTWVQYYGITVPTFEGPALTSDADFIGTKAEAQVIANYLHGTAVLAGPDDHSPNSAIVEFTGGKGEKLHIDMLFNVLGISDNHVRKLAVEVQLYDWEPINVLHPVLVLESRFKNLELLEHKRTANGVTQARVACTVAKKYLEECLKHPSRRREALEAAKRIGKLAFGRAGVFVWRKWGIDPLTAIDPDKMPGQFRRSWEFTTARVERKRGIAVRNARRPSNTGSSGS